MGCSARPAWDCKSAMSPPATWRSQFAAGLTSADQLPLGKQKQRALARVIEAFPMRIPPGLVALIDWNNPRCPVRRQLVPDVRELRQGGRPDPLDEERHRVGPGLIRRFDDRLLAQVSSVCPAHCRHCNRKRAWTQAAPDRLRTSPEGLARALSKTGRVREVILSGGEPLMRSDRAISDLLEAARSRPGVELLRIHSRAPVVLPARITTGLVRRLRTHAPLWFVTHFNCAAELSAQAVAAVARLSSAGIPVLNQAVLLRGVNDSVSAQRRLGRALLRAGVKPHYLFQLDRATGSLHFQVPLKKSMRIVARLQASSSGLLVPQLMVDLPGRGGKVPLHPGAIIRWTDRGAWLRGADGREAFYPDGDF